MNKAKVLLFAISIFISGTSFGQEDKKDNDYKKQFDEFKKDINKKFEDFKTKNDSVFLKFLEDSWKEFKIFRNERTLKPKPKAQPVISEQIDSGFKITPIKKERIILDTAGAIQKNIEPERKININEFRQKTDVDFYGSELSAWYNPDELPELKKVSKEGIADFFDQAASVRSVSQTAYLLKTAADSLELNDWGFILLLKNAARKMFNSLNEQKLFVWYALLKNDFDVKSGFDQLRVYLLIHTRQELFNTSYFNVNNNKYYIIRFNDDPDDVSLLMAHQAGYPGADNYVSLYINKAPLLNVNNVLRNFTFREKTLHITINKNLVDYYNDYPDAGLTLYFNTPLSEPVLQSINKFFRDILKDKSQKQIIDILLEFIQYSVKYKPDLEQFGYEKYMFAEEALFYPYADCEDRSVLLARLVSYFTGLPAIGLSYPAHVSLAVAFSEPFKGDYLFFNGKDYYICDPTYIGAKSGMGMTILRNIRPEVIDYER